MADGFDDRRNVAEKQFAMNQEKSFVAKARGAKFFGEWVATLLNKKGAEVEAYAQEFVPLIVGDVEFKNTVAKAKTDLTKNGTIKYDDAALKDELKKCIAKAGGVSAVAPVKKRTL